MSANDRIELGYISGCHGVQGWVKVFSYSDPVNHIFTYQHWQLEQKDVVQTVTVLKHQGHGKKLTAQLQSINSRTDAEALVGAKIFVASLPELPTGEYYWRDLIGLEVVNTKQEKLGVVESLQPTGANDVLIVKDAEIQRLIPYTYGVHVISVDISGGKIVVDWELDY